jgi:hypothetical protein
MCRHSFVNSQTDRPEELRGCAVNYVTAVWISVFFQEWLVLCNYYKVCYKININASDFSHGAENNSKRIISYIHI